MMIKKGIRFTFKNENGETISIYNPVIMGDQVMCKVNGIEWRFIPIDEIDKRMCNNTTHNDTAHGDLDTVAYRALLKYGGVPQMRHLQEECAELIAAINHWLRTDRRNEEVRQNLMKEMADVEIMLAQMKLVTDVKYDYPKVLADAIDSLSKKLCAQKCD